MLKCYLKNYIIWKISLDLISIFFKETRYLTRSKLEVEQARCNIVQLIFKLRTPFKFFLILKLHKNSKEKKISSEKVIKKISFELISIFPKDMRYFTRSKFSDKQA